MKKLTLLLILAIIMVSACKKKEDIKPMPDPAPLTDFLYLPVKDAEWSVHLRGGIQDDVVYCEGLQYGEKDTAYNLYTTIKAVGTDTVIKKRRYYRFEISGHTTYTREPCQYSHGLTNSTWFLREDTASQQVFAYTGSIGDSIYEMLIVDYGTEKDGDEAKVSPFWPASYISGLNNVVIHGQKAKMWEVAYHHDKNAKFFYKAYGIGHQAGILPPLYLEYSEPVSLDFTYKGTSNHFDFDVHNDPQIFNIPGW